MKTVRYRICRINLCSHLKLISYKKYALPHFKHLPSWRHVILITWLFHIAWFALLLSGCRPLPFSPAVFHPFPLEVRRWPSSWLWASFSLSASLSCLWTGKGKRSRAELFEAARGPSRIRKKRLLPHREEAFFGMGSGINDGRDRRASHDRW